MRILTTILLAASTSGTALAHELGSGHSEAEQVAHQLLSLHHLPALALIVVLVAWVVRLIADAGRRRAKF